MIIEYIELFFWICLTVIIVGCLFAIMPAFIKMIGDIIDDIL